MPDATAVPRVNWNGLLVALPVAHLIITSIYLFAYCVGFGSGLAIFASPGDVFATSISNLIPIYIAALIFPVATTIHRHKVWKHATAEDQIAALPSEEQREEATVQLVRKRSLMKRAVWVVAVVALLASSLAYLLGDTVEARLTTAPVMLVIAIWLWERKPFGLYGWRMDLMILAISFLLSAVSTGIDHGQADRHYRFESQRFSHASCDGYVVLRRFSELYLAVGSEDRKLLIDKDCKPKLLVPTIRPVMAHERLPDWMSIFAVVRVSREEKATQQRAAKARSGPPNPRHMRRFRLLLRLHNHRRPAEVTTSVRVRSPELVIVQQGGKTDPEPQRGDTHQT